MMRGTLGILAFFSFFPALTAPTAWAQGIRAELQMRADQKEVEVGQTLLVEIKLIQASTGGMAGLEEPSIATPLNFEIRGRSSTSQISMVGMQTAVVATTRLRLKAVKVGNETLGPARMIHQDATGQRQELVSNTVTVSVVEKRIQLPKPKKEPTPAPEDASAPEDALRDIKPLAGSSRGAWPWILGLAIAALLAGFLWRQLRPGGTRKAAGAPPLEGAARLKAAWKKLADEGLTGREFCLGLSELVRECLQYRFGFPAVDRTTAEILTELRNHQLTADEAAAVEKCLRTCDRVLYANGNVGARDTLRTLASALLPKTKH